MFIKVLIDKVCYNIKYLKYHKKYGDSTMIQKFSCHDFRNIICDELEFEHLNILIGPNNSGKSNFIRALSFAANMVGSQLTDSTYFLSELRRNGWENALNRWSHKDRFNFVWQLQIEGGNALDYNLSVHTGKSREDNYICHESLNSDHPVPGCDQPYNYFDCHNVERGRGTFSTAGMENMRNKRLYANVASDESVLLQMDNLFFENKEMFSTPFVRDNIRKVLEIMKIYFQKFYSYSCTAFNVAAIREMQDIQNDGLRLKRDGSNFSNVFYRATCVDENFRKKYSESLRKLMPDCTGIRISEPALTTNKVLVELEFNGKFFPLSEVSDGTVHLLLLLLLLNLPENENISMLAIDEPEMNLHPAWQKVLAHEILRCQSVNQMFISTHSPDFLDEFTPEFLSGDVGIFVFDPSSKQRIRKLKPSQLKKDLEEWMLGDLYRIGDPLIGGWPQ